MLILVVNKVITGI